MYGGSEGEEGFYPQPPLPVLSSTGSTKRFKSHGKQLDNRHVVGDSIIPRKKRSAMNKRKCESVFPHLLDGKKLQHASNGMDDCSKNSEKEMLGDGANWSAGQVTYDPITKDEEEVVETLFALSNMLPKKPVKRRVRRTSKDGKVKSMKFANVSTELERSPRGNVKDNPLTGSFILQHPPKFYLDLNINAAQPYSERTPLLFKSDWKDVMPPSIDAANVTVSVELCPETGGVTQSSQHQSPLQHRHRQQNVSCPVGSIMVKQELLQQFKNIKESGVHLAHGEGALALLPGLPTTKSCKDEVPGLLMRSLSTEAPSRLDSTSASGHCSTESSFSNDKVRSVATERRNVRKRCAAHVYISYLIHAYQKGEKNPRWLVPPNQLRLVEKTHIGIAAVRDTNDSVPRYPTKIKISHVDQRMTSETLGSCTSLKPSWECLSLSAAASALKSTNVNANSNQVGNRPGSSEKLAFPYLHSTNQHQPFMPFSLPQAWHSTPYPELQKAAETQQLCRPRYQGGSFYNPTANQQQLPQIWEAQPTSKYISEGTLSDFLKWQNGRDDSSSRVPCTYPNFSTSHSSEMLGGKLVHRAQQHQIFAIPSLQVSSQHHFPGSNDESGGVFLANLA